MKSKLHHISVLLCAAVFWIGMGVLMVGSFFEGLSIHEALTTYIRDEISVNYHIDNADLIMMSSKQNADSICCLYKATTQGNQHCISVTFDRYTMHKPYKVCHMTLLPGCS